MAHFCPFESNFDTDTKGMCMVAKPTFDMCVRVSSTKSVQERIFLLFVFLSRMNQSERIIRGGHIKRKRGPIS